MTKKNKRERMFKRMEIKILIVCYSYSGKTRRIAEMIQKQTGGRLSRIYPRQPYPADFQSLLTQVREEIRTGRTVFSRAGEDGLHFILRTGAAP